MLRPRCQVPGQELLRGTSTPSAWLAELKSLLALGLVGRRADAEDVFILDLEDELPIHIIGQLSILQDPGLFVGLHVDVDQVGMKMERIVFRIRLSRNLIFFFCRKVKK